MRVNINGIWYDAKDIPIQVELSKSDKRNIANMHEDKFNYISFPDGLGWENAKAFDIPRINYLSERFGSKSFFSIDLDDTMLIAKQKLNLQSYSLPNLCDHFGIVNTESHSAKGDALATLELYKRLLELN